MHWILLLASLFLILVVPAESAEFVLMGRGAQTCGDFGSEYRIPPADTETDFFAWAQGYMSGMNIGHSVHGGITKNLSMPLEQEKSFLRTYCNEHPLADYENAVSTLYFRLPDLPSTK
jgi:hypothetical protein